MCLDLGFLNKLQAPKNRVCFFKFFVIHLRALTYSASKYFFLIIKIMKKDEIMTMDMKVLA